MDYSQPRYSVGDAVKITDRGDFYFGAICTVREVNQPYSLLIEKPNGKRFWLNPHSVEPVK